MPIIYPTGCDTNDQRLRFLERANERLRLLHNFVGLWFKAGITQAEYLSGIDALRLEGESGDAFILPDKIKSAYPFKIRLTQNDWQIFRDWWTPVRSRLMNELNTYKTAARRDKTWVPPIEDF